MFYTRRCEPRGRSATVSFFVGLPGRADAATGGGGGERGYWIRRRFSGRAGDRRVTQGDHRRIEGTESAEGAA